MRTYLVLLAALVSACGGGSPTSPTGASERFVWTVNGESFTASSNGRGARRGAGDGSGIELVGFSCGQNAGLSIQTRGASARTYVVGTTPQPLFGDPTIVGPGAPDTDVWVTWTADARSGDAARASAWVAPGVPRLVNGVWVPIFGSGSVTISGISADWVSGSFSFELVPDRDNMASGTRTLQGTFELSFREKKIC